MAIFGNALDVQGLAGDAMLEGLAFEKLHDNEILFFVLVDVVNGADVGVIQRRSGARFAVNALVGRMVLGELFRKKLQAHEAPEPQVLGFVDDAHAAAAELFHNTIVGDGAANHRKEGAIWLVHLRVGAEASQRMREKGWVICRRKAEGIYFSFVVPGSGAKP